jgi:RNA polymerase sigma-70 factor, ECF subfamily
MEWAIRRALATEAPETEAPLMMNEQAFGSFHARTVAALRAYVARVLGNATDADDIVQDAYIRLLRRPPNTDDPLQLRRLLFRISSNLIVDHWRRRRHESGPVDEHAEIAASPGRDVPLRVDMIRTFEKLKPQERAMMWLAYVEGASHREIGEALGVREGSVRVLLHRTRQKLAALIRNPGTVKVGPYGEKGHGRA